MKAIMAVSGLVLITFLLMHMYGNLKVFLGPEAYNHYAHWLKEDLLYPLLPKGVFIWVFRAVLLVCLVAHMTCAIKLWKRARLACSASGDYVNKKSLQQTYSSRTMRWGGVILGGFLVFHILQYTAQVATTGFKAGDDPYTMVTVSFAQWYIVLAYALWMVAVCMHVRHGVWSALTTLGANTSKQAYKVLNIIAYAVAIILYAGFMVMPLTILFGLVK